MKKLIFMIIIYLIPFFIYSQDNENSPDMKPKLIYVYGQYSGGKDKSSDDYTGNIGSRKIGMEYRIVPEIGFGVSLANSNASYFSKPNSQLAVASIYLANLEKQANPTNQNLTFIGAIAIVSTVGSIPYSYQYNTVSFDFNFHPLGDKLFDPYFGVSGIIGKCAGQSPCDVSGLKSRLGLQINIANIFINSNFTIQKIKIEEPTSSVTLSENKLIGFGAGFRF